MDAFKKLIAKNNPGMMPDSDDSEEEEFLDDDEMEAFDNKLVEIFKQRKEMKQVKKINKDLTLHFKARLLDLIDIYIKKQSSNPLLLTMVLPLLRLSLKMSNEFQIHEKISNILKNKLSKVKDVATILTDDGIIMLKEIHAIASKSSEAAFLNMCTGLCILVTRSIITNVTDAEPKRSKKSKTSSTALTVKVDTVQERIYEVYANSLEKKMTMKHCELSGAFFSVYAMRFPQIGWMMCAKAVECMAFDKVCKSFQLIDGAKLILGMLTSFKCTVILSSLSFNYLDGI